MPLMAVPMRVTATMPMMTPSAVSTDRIMLARIWVIAMRKDSMNSFQRRCMVGLVLADVAFDQAVAQADDAAGVAGDVLLVGDDDDGVALRVQVLEQLHDFLARAGVEIAGRLVGQ